MTIIKTLTKAIILVFLTQLVFWFGFGCAWVYRQKHLEPVTIEIYAPMSVQQTQLKLREMGYDIRADNIWGPETERAFCNYMAKKVWPKGIEK